MKRVFSSFLIFLFIASITFAVIAYSRGYRFDAGQKTLTSTGILAINSFPERASVWINDELVSATNTSLSLVPGEYRLHIGKEGYLPWKKTLRIQGEIVHQIDALLIPANPSLRTLTITGVTAPVLSPSGTKVAYIIPSEDQNTMLSAEKSGVWVVELRTGPFGGKTEPRLLWAPKAPQDWETSTLQWSSDEKTLVVSFLKDSKTGTVVSSLIQLSVAVPDVSPLILTQQNFSALSHEWMEEDREKEQIALSTLPDSVKAIISSSTAHVKFSPDETKLLYLATSSASLAPVITPPLIGSNQTEETRTIAHDTWYIYDKKEDKNFFVSDASALFSPSSILWYPDSKHLILVSQDLIAMIDYDGTNKRTVYAGPFDPSVVFPWPGGGKIVILTNFNNAQMRPNLYLIDLS